MSGYLRCYVCDAVASFGSPGWESELRGALDSKDFCPKHRRDRPKALTTLGEMLAAKATR